MKLVHDIENDLEHTIPTEGSEDSTLLFRKMTERSLALLALEPGARVLDLACGMGQDTLALAENALGAAGVSQAGLTLGVEPSNRMIRFSQMTCREWRKSRPNDAPVAFVRALGEELPFRANSFDGVLCKGALDHFMDPSLTMTEIGRVLKPGGRAVLAIANYDSLSCRLGKLLDRWKNGSAPAAHSRERPYYEPPPDHLTRFGYGNIKALPGGFLVPTRVEGISLLWQFPPWGGLLLRSPAGLRTMLLRAAFALARWAPPWADVIVLQAGKPF